MFVALEAGGAGDVAARVAAAEAAGFVFVTLSDIPGSGVDAGVWAAFLARRTHRIGLVPQLHVTVTEPFHLATQVASLDHASLGRAGWLVGADNSDAAYATVGEPRLDGPALRRETADVIDVARLLWDSWEDGAVLRDVTSGRFLDAGRVHHVNFTGARFSISGPLITPRPPQGQVVVAGPDTLGVTGRLDVALVAASTVDEFTGRAHRARTDGAALVFADLARVDTGLIDRLAGVVDGVRLLTVTDVDLPAVAATIGPRPPAGDTLRARLGLARPVNQFA